MHTYLYINYLDYIGAIFGMPDQFLRHAAKNEMNVDLPKQGNYAVGMLYMPQDKKARTELMSKMGNEINNINGCKILGWRDVPIDSSTLGKASLDSQPYIKQCFISSKNPDAAYNATANVEFERSLYLIRKAFDTHISEHPDLYVCSLSSQTIIYKGMLTAA